MTEKLNWSNAKRKLSDLIPWPRNPRKIGAEQTERLNNSLLEFAQVEPIAIGPNNEVYNGHQRLTAWAAEYGDLMVDVRVASRPLTEKEREKLTVYLHQGAVGEWDFHKLTDFDMQELKEWGFDDNELSEIKFDDPLAQTGNDAEPQIDKAEELREKWGVVTGQLWQLGDHRLICGDCTDAAVVARVLDGAVPVLMVTDPPYGVEYDANWRNEADRANGKPYGDRAVGKVENDDRADWHEAWALFPGDVAYVWHAMKTQHAVACSVLESGFEIRAEIVWAKNALVISQGHYHPQHESCFYAVRKGATGRWAGDRKQTTLWQIDKPQKSETGHSTQKPVECMARPMRNHDAQEVYDPFLGSGTSLIAAESIGRRAYCIEISPAYVAVALERFHSATNKMPCLISGE